VVEDHKLAEKANREIPGLHDQHQGNCPNCGWAYANNGEIPTIHECHPGYCIKNASALIHQSGRASSKIPPLHLIPHASLIALARRLGRGVRIKGIKGAWNACSKDQTKTMEDREFLIERLAHGIDHCYKAIARLNGQLPPLDQEETDDGGDAGAIMFAGALLAAVDDYERRKAEGS
jgi:hypothetical protein